MARQIATTDDQQEAAEILAEIETQERDLWKLTLEVNNAKLTLKAAKEDYDAGVAHLRALARTRLEEHPLLEAADESEDDENV